MSQQININDSKTFVPSGYTGASNISVSTSTNPPSNAYSDHTSTTYAQLTTSSTSTVGYIYFTFQVSGIPANATITGVSCQAKIRINNTSRVTNTSARLYANTTAKGSSQSFSSTSTSNVITINGGTSWSSSELSNMRLRIAGQKGSSNNSGYIYFYGATLTINYSIQGTQYDITATLSTDAVSSIDPAGLTQLIEGSSYELSIYADSIDDFKVEDNGTNVTTQLVEHTTAPSGTVSAVPGTMSTGFSASGCNFYTSSSTTTTARLQDPIGHTAESPASQPYSNQWTYVKDGGNNSATGWAIYDFDFSSIPEDATITSVSVKVYGAKEDTSTSSQSKSMIGLYSGNTRKSTEQEFTSSTPYIMTISSPGTWTRAELQNAKLRHTVAYYGGWTGGATWTVQYTVASTTYWTYSIPNVQADHVIVISDSIIEIPDEDPQYNYYPVTISSINASTTPGRGTTRVVEGTTETITIVPSDPLVTLITDNGVDITSQLVQHGGNIPDPTVATLSGASYGFTMNNQTGYYTSANKGVSRSAAVCRVSFDLPVRCLVTIQYINYAEATYDFGVFGNIDTALSTNYYSASSSGATITDSSYKLACNTSAYNSSSAKTLTYEIPAGQHYIDIKFSKDDASDSNNDTLQWKITSIEPLEPNNYYTYTISNINEAHSLIFIFGDVTYYTVTSSGTGCKLYPSGSVVQLPGDTYTLTVVPDDYGGTVTATDNNTSVTSSLERVEQEVTKDGVTYTVVNYIYKLTNIQGTHNITVTCSSQNSSLYIKINGGWVQARRVYVKTSGEWREQTGADGIFHTGVLYTRSL